MNHEEKARGTKDDRWGDVWGKRAARALMELDRMCSEHSGAGCELRAFKVKFGATDQYDTTVVVTAFDEAGAPVVAFGSGTCPSEALISTIHRIANSSLKWKDDQYA